MSTFDRLFFLLITILIGSSASYVFAQSPDLTSSAKAKLNQGICAFKDKNYALAQQDFEKALELDPTNRLISLFLARAVYFQYDPDVDTANNLAKGREAFAAYMRVLNKDPDNQEAADTIADLYTKTEPDGLREIATSETTNKAIRVQILLNLANKSYKCANDITYHNQVEIKRNGKTTYSYHMPRTTADFDKAQNCARLGVKLVEQAIELAPNYRSSWLDKWGLLLQMARLAEMQRHSDEKAEFEKQAQAAKNTESRIYSEETERRDKANEEALKKRQRTSDQVTEEIEKFVATGRFRREHELDEYDIDSPFTRLVAPLLGDRKQEPTLPKKLPWKTFVSTNREFSALMPSPVRSGGKNNSAFSVDSEDIYYYITYMDMPPAPVVGIEQIMSGFAWDMADTVCDFRHFARSTCEVDFDKKLLVGIYPGIQYNMAATSCRRDDVGLIRVYATPKRIYEIVVIGANEQDQRVSRFLSSVAIDNWRAKKDDFK